MLGLSDNTSEYFRFKPSVNAWYVDGEEIDFKGMGIDPASLRTGWGKISEGQAPEWLWDERPGVKGRQPDSEFKRGFSVMVYIKAYGWREWTSTGSGPKMGLEAVWPSIHNGAAANPEKMAMVAFNGAKAVSIGKGTTRVPDFELKGWHDKPEGNQPQQTPQAASQPMAQPVSEPQPEPVPQAARAKAKDDWEF
jgi:hypothetical protein